MIATTPRSPSFPALGQRRPARRLPQGEVTFVSTGVEGSAELSARLGGHWRAAVALHDDVLRACMVARGGHEVSDDGGALLFAFDWAGDAARAALDAQRALARAAWPGGTPLRVRIGIHTGHAVPHEGQYSSPAVVRSARVAGAARGGEVLVSDATRARVACAGLGRVEVVPVSRVWTTDFDGAEPLFVLVESAD